MLWSPPVNSLPRQHRANDDRWRSHRARYSGPRSGSGGEPAGPGALMTRIRPAIPCVAAAMSRRSDTGAFDAAR
jgi:hypothetical protein